VGWKSSRPARRGDFDRNVSPISLHHARYTLNRLPHIILLWSAALHLCAVPLFNWLRDRLHLARNDFERLGHFAQGFVPR